MSNETCRRCNGKQQRRKRDGRNVPLTAWVMNKIKRQHIIALDWVTKMKSLLYGESLDVEPTPPTTHHPPSFQFEATRVSAKPLQGGWVG